MAVVRITNDLKSRILNNTNTLFDDKFKKTPALLTPEEGEQIYLEVMKEYLPLIEQLPTEFFYRDRGYALLLDGNNTNCYPYFPNDTLRVFPKGSIKGPDCLIIGGHASRISLHADGRWAWVLQRKLEIDQHRQTICDERTAFQKSVSTVLEAYSTLAPALRAWPALWDLVPADTQAKHKEVKERKPKEVDLSEKVDLSSLTAVLAASKLKGDK